LATSLRITQLKERFQTMKRLIAFIAAAGLAAALSAPVEAQVGARFVLRSGEQVSGELVDMGGSGFTARVNGQTRTWSVGDVAVIDFTGNSSFPTHEINAVNGNHVLVTRGGEVVAGTLYDVGGTNPLRLTFSVNGANRDYSSNDVARIYFARPGTTAAATPSGTSTEGLAAASGRIQVPASAGWVNTGLTVQQGQTILLTTTGEVRLSADANDVATPAGAKSGRTAPSAPLPGVLAGALIGRVGNGQPFGIGNQTSIPAPNAGTLFLAVNDDQLSDNAGAFGVEVTASATQRRRR
jgi:hypothetical protein